MSLEAKEGAQCNHCTRNTVRLFDTTKRNRQTVYACPNCDGETVKISHFGAKNKTYPYIEERNDLHDKAD